MRHQRSLSCCWHLAVHSHVQTYFKKGKRKGASFPYDSCSDSGTKVRVLSYYCCANSERRERESRAPAPSNSGRDRQKHKSLKELFHFISALISAGLRTKDEQYKNEDNEWWILQLKSSVFASGYLISWRAAHSTSIPFLLFFHLPPQSALSLWWVHTVASQTQSKWVGAGEDYVLLEGSMNLISFCVLKTVVRFANLTKVVKFSTSNNYIWSSCGKHTLVTNANNWTEP